MKVMMMILVIILLGFIGYMVKRTHDYADCVGDKIVALGFMTLAIYLVVVGMDIVFA